MSTSPAARRARAGLLLSVLALPACPQVLPDDFRTGRGAGGSPEAGPSRPPPTDPSRGGAGSLLDAGAGGAGGAGRPFEALAHRYSFEGTGVHVSDSVGAAHGEAVGAQLTGTGELSLPGGASAPYVNLPNGIISALNDATIEAWLVWHGGASWQRVFDFGSSTRGEGLSGSGATYLFFTPSASQVGLDTPRVAYSLSGYDAEIYAAASAPFPSERLVHVAVVIDDTNDVLALYIDGQASASAVFTGALRDVRDDNNWLGRSQYDDPALSAELFELRVHASALSAADIARSHASGPDPVTL